MNDNYTKEVSSKRVTSHDDIQLKSGYTLPQNEIVMETEMSSDSFVEVRGISINPLNSGYMVKVGCQSVAVETTETLIDMLNKYLTNPADFERKWYSNNVRNRLANIK